ncbi:MAG: sulfite exporter TauE/SafE family protein [Treponema sp.]|uniref:urease accessory protein UreH domain-containing protein n=1 Tax=Treponema sp. TaxID=166 RepID=UPI002A9206D7|nr:sulfite exporter TauE/SafE family protein [Treponema sp.]MDY6397811.1 sulfite exporter TauE/SafE family protein [Treponema sp.]
MSLIILKISGMTCINCKTRIENALAVLEGIKKADVSWEKGRADIEYDEEKISLNEIQKIIESLDYKVENSGDGKWKKSLSRVLINITYLIIITFLFLILQKTGLLNYLAPAQTADSKMSYGLLFLTGLFTSVHCIAMCGGINLSQSLGGNRAVIKYNSARILSYTLIGLVLGSLGVFLGTAGKNIDGSIMIPFSVQSVLKLVAGVFMILMGFSLLGLFPFLRRITPHLPSALTRKIYSAHKKQHGAFLIGFLNGFMPCGPLQAMWIVAFVSGSPLSGTLSMLFFSLGTLPLMLGFSSIISIIGKKKAGIVMKAGAILVVVMGLSMISQGYALGGIKEEGIKSFDKKTIELQDGKQLIKSRLEINKYPDITVKKGIPVRWEIQADKNSLTGCNYRMILRDFKLGVEMGYGTNVIEFTPEKTGNFKYTCRMGMINGKIKVVE